MKITTASNEQIRERMGADCTTEHAILMRELLSGLKTTDTDEISDTLWFALVAEATKGTRNPAAVALGRIGGKKTTEAQTAARRLNGAKGGRPATTMYRILCTTEYYGPRTERAVLFDGESQTCPEFAGRAAALGECRRLESDQSKAYGCPMLGHNQASPTTYKPTLRKR